MVNDFKKIAKCDCLTDLEDLYAYSNDTSPKSDKNLLPDAVFFPETIEDVQKIVKYCFENNISVIPRGAGTCHTGGCRVVKKPCVILHLSKMNKILEINKENMIAKVQPNVILGDFQQ